MPQLITHTKSTAMPCFLIVKICWNCRSKPCFKGLFEKSPLKIRKNFPQTHRFILVKLLRFQRTFHEKSFVSGFGATPQHSIHTKSTALPCFLLLIYHRFIKIKRFEISFQVAEKVFFAKRRKIPKCVAFEREREYPFHGR